MNKKLSSIVSSTKSGPESGLSEGVKFKKLKIKQQKLKDKSSSLSSAVIGSSSSSLLVLTDSGPEFSSKDHLLSSLLYSLNQSILTIQSPLPPFLIPDHFKSFLKFSLKSSSSHNLTTQFPFPFSTRALSLIEAETLGTTAPLLGVNEADNLTAIPMPLPSWIKIKEYAPIVFASLRDKVYSFPTKTVFKESLLNPWKGPPSKVRDAEQPRTIYVTSDCQLLIKTIDGSDLDGFLSLLKSLHPYLVQRKPGAVTSQPANASGIAVAGSPPPTPACLVNSLLPQYMAVYRLSYAGSHSYSSMIASTVTSGTSGLIGSATKVSSSDSHFYLVVMRNPLSSDESFFPIHYFYNVTADGVKRNYASTTSSCKEGKKHSQVNTSFPSGDSNSDFTLTLKKDDAERLLSNLEADLKFLCSHLLVGYSLSVGIHSIDLWERELAEDEDEDDDDAEEEDESSLVASITQQFQGLRAASTPGANISSTSGTSAATSPPNQSSFSGIGLLSDTGAVRKSLRCKKRKESLSLVIDSLRHPFALPSPFVGVDSRASSRPSLHSEQSECDSGLVGDASRSNGRFVYWVGFSDLLPLSASFSSKEIREFREREKGEKMSKKDKEKASKLNDTDKDNNLHQDDSLPYDSGASGTGEGVSNTSKPSKEAKEEMGKKEAAREYSKNLLNQMRRRIRIVEQ